MNRRNFLGAMLAACTAPAIVRAGSLMRIAAPEIIVPDMTVILQQYSTLYAQTAREIGVDPLGARGYVGAIWWRKELILNEDWMKLK